MNGLLHRVAARAAGTAVPVRADVALAYAGGEAGPIDIVEARADVPTATAPGQQMMPLTPAAPGHEWPAQPVVPPGDSEIARVPSMPVSAKPTVDHVRGTVAPAANPAAMPPARLTQPADFTAPRPVLPALLSASPEPHRVPAALDPGPRAPAARTAAAAGDPAPLMAPAARPTALAPLTPPPVRRGATPQGSTAAPGEDNTEVHIHIGRIDVTAVHETPAARRRAPGAPAPMSLDGYLAKQGRS